MEVLTMVQPFNYSLNVLDPAMAIQQGMAFGQQMRAGEQAQAMNAQQMELRAADEARAQTAFGQQNLLFDQQQEDRAAAQAASEAQNADLIALSEKVAAGQAGAADFAAIATKYPELATEMGSAWEGVDKAKKDTDIANIYKGITAIKAGRPDIAVSLLEERAVAAENAGDQQEADIARATAAAIEADPNAGLTSLGLLLQVIDPKATETIFGAGKSVQSTIPYENGTTVTVFDDGSKQVSDAAGNVLTGKEAIAAVEAAQANEAEARGANAGAAEEAKLDAKIDKAGEAAASEEAGKQAIAKSGEAFDSLNKARANIVNVDTAIAALDRGANSGAIAKYFPNISEASASLENAMNRLGLDVIGSVTFGALSEGEMRLAMETAVPRNLDEAELRQWLLDKKAAQEKAAEALRAAAIYLGTPGNTLASWLESQGKPTGEAADQGLQGAVGDQSLDDLLREAEGL